jgi:hypothetical protein
MANNDTILRVLLRNGTDQPGRTDAALDPDSVRIQGFELEDWMQFARSFAEKIHFFSAETGDITTNWQSFFPKDEAEIRKLTTLIRETGGGDGTLTPHLTLFVCFLQLLELSTQRMNNLTRRHLDFYYQQVLKIEKLPATEDRVHVLFELARSISDYLVDEETELDSGKDASGKKRVYEVEQEIVASKTKVAQIRNVYNEHNIVGEPGLLDENRYYIKASPVADSADGIGGKLPADEPAWYPFGYYTSAGSDGIQVSKQKELPEKAVLPNARLGCAVASPVLRLSEGKRLVTARFTFKSAVVPVIPAEDPNEEATSVITPKDLNGAFEVWLTGGKKWLGPYKLTIDEDTENADKPYSRVEGNVLLLSVFLDTDELPVTDYDPAVHGEQFDTTAPVARFIVKTDTAADYRIYSAFAGENVLENVEVIVDVKGMKKLVLESDTGTLNPEKPFYPFTTQPVRGSSFSVFNQEAFDKKWTDISLNLKWKNTPLSFESLYTAYESTFASSVSVNKYETMFKDFNYANADTDFSEQFDLVKDLRSRFGISQDNVTPVSGKRAYFDTTSTYQAIVKGDDYFKVDILVQNKEEWELKINNGVLFNEKEADGSFETTIAVTGAYDPGRSGPVRLVLQQSFLHEMYPRLYAVAISSKEATTLIPNEPYTPFAEDVTLNYKASDSVFVGTSKKTTETEFADRTTQLFHEHPFGQSEEHSLIRSVNGLLTDCHVFPTYCKGGELYIGLENARTSDLVSLLIQVAEGTENPLAKSFQAGQKVHWDILCNNVWRTLDSDLMITNEIDNFLHSGRVKFVIPPYATDTNTLLPAGLFWVRAKTYKRYDVFCKVLGIHAQAAVAKFDNRGNNLSHLTTGIPAGTIAKPVERVSQIKSVIQPYASFGGKPEESDALYYRRVSERLRHKNRAITLWDYEHLILQEFPEVYKAKCLNHTSEEHFTTPGSVTIVVIPDTISKTVFDVYQPRVSRAVLNRIKNRLTELTSMHLSLNVMNPNYEEVQIALSAKFHKGLDENHYKKQLQEDLMKFLSPWAFEQAREITFGVTLHRSRLIHYIEKLNYVDYIEDVKIFKKDERQIFILQPKNCAPSDPKSILVSAREHKIELAIKTCQVNPTLETEEQCQL